MDAHRSTSVEDEDFAPNATCTTTITTTWTASATLRVSAAASDARGVATGQRRMDLRL